MRLLTEQDIKKAIQASQFNLVHFKTKTSHIHVLLEQAVQDLNKLKPEFKIVFEKYKHKFLFGKNKPINEKSLIAVVNRDLDHTCQISGLPFNIKSHSFCINKISNLLRVTSLQNTASIIEHSDIRSTLAYKQYSLTKEEIQDLLKQIEETNQKKNKIINILNKGH